MDTFTYRVRDRLGAEGTATIRVGVAPPEAMNQAPYAVKDAVVVRPGRSVAVPVLANDSDPEGDKIGLVRNGLEEAGEADVTAEVSGSHVIVEVPDRELETSLQYTIEDERGGQAQAPIVITVDEDVPLMTPIARDDRIRIEDLKDDLTVDLDILTNDEDPDGTVKGLEVAVEDGGRLLEDRTVRVSVTEKRQLIRYTVTDQDEQISSAFIFVPAISELRPTLTSTKPVEVKSGETKELPLEDYVVVAGGGDVRLTEASKVSAAYGNGDSLIKDTTTLVYTSKDDYFGPDALVFEVTDGDGPDDPEGRTSVLTLPITVLPPENQQPEFVSGQMQVAPGEKATTLDLAALTTDPDPEDADKLRFSTSGQPGEGVSVRVEGTELVAEAASNAKKGTAVTVPVRITDGTTEPVDGTVEIVVSASTRSMPVANPDTIDQADQGETITVPVLDNDTNPFKSEGKPLDLLSVTVESGDGTANVVGDQVEVTPGANFVGVMIVRYRIADATEDPDREVDGRITVTVQGVPDAPGKPTVSTVEDRTVVLAWSPPSNNGAEITEYTVEAVSGRSYSKTCASTTCTLDGLTNNVSFTFQVTAHNRVGEGEPSPVSEPARPDTRPDTPAPPTLVFGDKSLNVSWTTPPSSGSPVDSYTLEISPTPPSGIGEKAGVTGNSLVWEGLENGTDYTVRVRAHNQAPEPSEWSAPSLAETPAGVPGAPPAPRVSSAPSVGTEAQMTVSWDPAFQNGDSIDNYELRIYRGGSLVRSVTVAGSQTSQTVSVPTNAADYTYTVRASNKAGWGSPSAPSAPQRAFGSPGAPTGVNAQPLDRAVRVTFTKPSGNGATDAELRYQYQLNNNGTWNNWNGTSDIGGLSNGSTYTVQVRAYSVVGGQQSQPGAAGSSNQVVPYGPVRAPTGDAVNLGTSVRLSWDARNSDNGRAITRTEINIDGGGWQNAGSLSGSVTRGNGYDQTHSIRVRVTDDAGQTATSPLYSAKTDAPPAPRVWVTKGSNGASCVNGPCKRFVVNWENLNIGSAQVWCNSSSPNGYHIAGHTYTVNFDGRGSTELSCYQGQDNVNVWIDIVGWGDSVDTETQFWAIP